MAHAVHVRPDALDRGSLGPLSRARRLTPATLLRARGGDRSHAHAAWLPVGFGVRSQKKIAPAFIGDACAEALGRTDLGPTVASGIETGNDGNSPERDTDQARDPQDDSGLEIGETPHYRTTAERSQPVRWLKANCIEKFALTRS
jgi:hypothetical protein